MPRAEAPLNLAGLHALPDHEDVVDRVEADLDVMDHRVVEDSRLGSLVFRRARPRAGTTRSGKAHDNRDNGGSLRMANRHASPRELAARRTLGSTYRSLPSNPLDRLPLSIVSRQFVWWSITGDGEETTVRRLTTGRDTRDDTRSDLAPPTLPHA